MLLHKYIIIPLIVLLCLVGGCAGVTGEVLESVTVNKTVAPPETTAQKLIVVRPSETPEPIIKPHDRFAPLYEPLATDYKKDAFEISPAKVLIDGVVPGNYYHGGLIRIINSFNEDIDVDVYLGKYGGQSFSEGDNRYYEPAPDGFESIICINGWGDYMIPARNSLTLPIELDMPDDMSIYPDSWEFHVKASVQDGVIKWTRIQRWLITMR